MAKRTRAEADAVLDAAKSGDSWVDPTKIVIIETREHVRRYLQDIHGFSHDDKLATIEITLHSALPEGTSAAVNACLAMDQFGVWYTQAEDNVTQRSISQARLIPWSNIAYIDTTQLDEEQE